MNRITRCPSCATVYRVGDVQLRAAGGWLRCGQCQNVFDSTGFVLFWLPPEDGLSVAAPLVDTPKVSDPVPEECERIVVNDFIGDAYGLPPLASSPVSAELTSFEEALSTFEPHLDPLRPEPTVDAQAPLLANSQAMDASTGSVAASFTKIAYLTALCLLALLAFQLLFVQRHHLVQRWPDTEVFFQNLCSTMGCEITPQRDVDGLVIESSSLVRRANGFVLRWTVRNTTNDTLAMSALELTLINAPDKPVLRKVFSQSQLGVPALLTPGQTSAGELTLKIDDAITFTDYRILNFYP